MPLLSTFGAASARSFGGIGAAAAAGAGLDINEAFSTYVYDGTGSAKTITNGTDLSGEGGMVWIKKRSGSANHTLQDTVRGATKHIRSSGDSSESTEAQTITAFNSNGFSLGTDDIVNASGSDYVSWTFRKAKKFFDVVTYTGNGSNRTIAHNLNCEVGMMLVKLTSGSDGWAVYHRGLDSSAPEDYRLRLDGTNARIDNTDGSRWNRTAPTSSVFSLGTDGSVNANGSTYVAYLFAHNSSDGEFGPDSDQDVIKCGSVTIGGTGNATVNLGFEPQWLMIKNATGSGYDWQIFDTMRGFKASPDNDAPSISANTSSAESGQGDPNLTSTGFEWDGGGGQPNATYIYMAIRRGPLAEPTSATDVFQPVVSNVPNPNMVSTNLSYIDMAISKKEAGGQSYVQTRLTGDAFLKANGTDAETTGTSLIEFDHNNKMRAYFDTYGSDHINYFWKRAPSYFDVVAFSGNSTAGRTVSHNLGVAPEMMWVKQRGQAEDWIVYHSALANTKAIRLNSTIAAYTDSKWNNTTPTSTVFSLDNSNIVNGSGRTYIAYLFATVAGVSKVGSYTSNGAQQNIDCGFSNGARFVLVKRTDGTGHWITFDSTRGITANNDPHLRLNDTSAEDADGNIDIEPYSSGFTVNYGSNNLNNNTGQTYIFYAIAA